LVRWVLNLRLDKHEQMSNWARRPLRDSQLKYAALDAMTECWLYDELKKLSLVEEFPELEGFIEELYGAQ